VDYGDDLNFCPQCGGELIRRESAGGMIGGAYRVIEPIGKGWAASVYRAEHVMMGRPTALKVVTSAAVAERDFVDRFREAAHLLSDLSDPRIATVHDMGIDLPNHIYVATDLVEGKSLAAIIREGGPLPPQKVLDIVRIVIKGLRTAHALGVIHGSIKPSNVIMGRDGPKIVDFATRRIISATGDESFTTMTSFGPVYGEPAYLAPEQVKGAAVTARTDVYGLGLLMYEMLTGGRPFRMELARLVADAQVETVPESPREFKPQLKIPKFIDMAVMRALSKDPDNRQQTVMGLYEELEGEIVAEKAPAAPSRPTVVVSKRRRPPARPPKKAPREVPAAARPARAPEEKAGGVAAAEVRGPRFMRYEGKQVKSVWPVAKDTVVIGRSSECDIVVDAPGVSRRHARVTVKPGRILVEDLGSLNGTYINDDAIKRGHIEDGDRLSLGNVDLYFRND